MRKDKSLQDLILDVAREALEHAGLAAGEVDEIWLGHFSAGMVDDAFASSLVPGLDPVMRFTPATRLETPAPPVPPPSPRLQAAPPASPPKRA